MSYAYEFTTRGSGDFIIDIAGESLDEHKLVYRENDDLWHLADADAAATMPVLGITLEAIASGKRGRILFRGYIADSVWSWTTGGDAGKIYASAVAGELTQTPPVGLVQMVAIAFSPTGIWFDSSGLGGNAVTVRKNAGANVGTRPRLNFNEGANMTLTITDDPIDNEIDIDLASAGGGGTAWLDQFFSAVDTTAYKGTYPTVPMIDLVDTDVWQTFMIPAAIVTIVRAALIIIPNASGNIRWGCSTNFGRVCANESYQQHTDSIALGTTAVDQNQIECLDISAALTGAAGEDLVGIKFTRTASHANDTISETVHYLGILIQGSV